MLPLAFARPQSLSAHESGERATSTDIPRHTLTVGLAFVFRRRRGITPTARPDVGGRMRDSKTLPPITRRRALVAAALIAVTAGATTAQQPQPQGQGDSAAQAAARLVRLIGLAKQDAPSKTATRCGRTPPPLAAACSGVGMRTGSRRAGSACGPAGTTASWPRATSTPLTSICRSATRTAGWWRPTRRRLPRPLSSTRPRARGAICFACASAPAGATRPACASPPSWRSDRPTLSFSPRTATA